MTKKIVEIKNIDPLLADIRRPDFNYKNVVRPARLNLGFAPRRLKIRERGIGRTILRWGAALVFVFLTTISLLTLFNLRQVKAIVASGGARIAENFVASIEAIKNWKPEEAGPALNRNSEEISRLNAILGRPYNKTIFGFLGTVLPVFREAGSFISDLGKLNLNFLKLSEDLADIQTNGFYYFQTDGETLLGRLNAFRSAIREALSQIESVRNSTAELKSISPALADAERLISEEYLRHKSDLFTLDKFLAALINLFGSPEDRQILLMFQNPAEIRPAGGFLGSYGIISVKVGQMAKLEVQDIYWPDHPMNFDLKVIPPEPLQAVVTDWAARDGNWFFDFPTSAKTVINFLESSKIYKESNFVFEGAIALNIRVMETILGFTGPVPLESYDLTIGPENFLIEVQREVETGRDKKPGENPKLILSVLTPLVLEKINSLPTADRKLLFEEVKKHVLKKDIMLYAKDAELSSFFASKNLDGAVYDLPTSFWGSYLAVANANIAGGKSDAFIKETLAVRTDVDNSGSIFTDLTVTRKHEGNVQKDPWWRATNQNFIQIFTNPGSNLVSLTGNDLKRYAKPEYGKSYSSNSDLRAIESSQVALSGFDAWSMSAFGKTVFAAWFNVPAGKTETLLLRYQSPAPAQAAVSEGRKFRYIFERQSGVKNALKLTIGAPLGYLWAETASPVFVYESDDPDGRVILDLTLAK